jgi:glyoxylase-like metal-dependent hydrolase (beta-lactamase superfamily II)
VLLRVVVATFIEETEAMKIQHFFDSRTCTLTYVVSDDATRKAVVFDSVLDFDARSGRTSQDSVEEVDRYLTENQLELAYILDTHAHADHLSGAQFLKPRHGAKIGIGANIIGAQETFKTIFGMGEDFETDGAQFDLLLQDGDTLPLGSLSIKAIHTPGHTPACMCYLIGDALFTGDALFVPDAGTGRCDFPNGSAADLYDSVCEKLYALPDEIRVFVGHDYQPGGRDLQWETTIGESKAGNVALRQGTGKEEFVKFRKQRDATLDLPALIFPSLQVNICAGQLPEAEDNGIIYLKIPVNVL